MVLIVRANNLSIAADENGRTVEETLDMKIPDDLWDDVSNIGEAVDSILLLQAV